MSNISELNDILYMYLSNNNPEDFIYIQRIIDTILKNNRKYECKEFNTYVELYKSLKLVYEFLEELNPNYRKYFERKINDETISFDYTYQMGYSYIDNSMHKRILIPVNHNINDSFVIIHELMHNKNLKVDKSSITRHLFTECFSILGEMLFNDYLVKNNIYKGEAGKHMEDIFWATTRITKKNDFETKLSISFLCNGYLDSKSFTDLYSKDDEYNWQIYYSIIDALNYKTLSIDTEQRYSIGILFASYLHQRILDNPKKIYEFFELNDIINDITVEELMHYLDLEVENTDNTVLTFESLETLGNAYKKELKSLR